MNRILAFIPLLFLSCLPALAQSAYFEQVPRSALRGVELPAYAEAIKLEKNAFSTLRALPIGEGYTFELNIPIIGKSLIDAERFKVLADNAEIIEAGENGMQTVALEEPLFFSAAIQGMEKSFIYLMITEKEVRGTIEFKSGIEGELQQFEISPFPEGSKHHGLAMIVRPEDVPGFQPGEQYGGECHFDDSFVENDGSEHREETPMKTKKGRRDGIQKWTMKVAKVAVEGDYYFYTELGGNLHRASHSALYIVGIASAAFRRDIQLTLEVPFLRVWTKVPAANSTPDNPYTEWGAKTRKQYREAFGSELSLHWRNYMYHVDRHVLVGLMGDADGGHAAGIGVNLCSTAQGTFQPYCVNRVASWNLSGAGGLVTHELGHNFGSRHTSNCDYYSPAIDSCISSDDCTGSQHILREGTIMSYCVPKTQRFHARVQDVIRTTIDAQSCIHVEDQNLAFDMAVMSVLVPQAGATVYNGAPGVEADFTPCVSVKNVGTMPMSNVSVEFKITPWGSDVPVYLGVESVSLNAGVGGIIEFDKPLTANLPVNNYGYTATVTIQSALDQYAGNDIRVRHFAVTDQAPTETVTLVYPNGGTLYAGEPITLEINAPVNTRVLLDYSPDDRISWTRIGEVRDAQNTVAHFDWTVPTETTAEGRIRATLMGVPGAVDLNDVVFSIVEPHDLEVVEFVAPLPQTTIGGPFTPKVKIRNNGSAPQFDFLVQFTIHRVKPLHNPKDDLVYIDVQEVSSLGAGLEHTVEFTEAFLYQVGPNTNEFVVRAEILPIADADFDNNYLERLIEVQGSNAAFAVTHPIGATWLQPGQNIGIHWTDNSGQQIPFVDLLYTTDGDTWHTIVQGLSNVTTNFYVWDVPNTPAWSTVRIRVQESPWPGLYYGHSEFFSIREIEAPRNLEVEPQAVTGLPRLALSWEVSPSEMVDGYDIYRSVNGGSFTLLTNVAGKQTSAYNDDNVQSCNTYAYQIKSVVTLNSVNYESAFSNQVQETALATITLGDYSVFDKDHNNSAAEPHGIEGAQSARLQFLVLAGELGDFTLSNEITDIAFRCVWAELLDDDVALQNYTVKMKHSTKSSLSSTFDDTDFTTVFGPATYTEIEGWSAHNFHTGFSWDGMKNIIVEICWTSDDPLPAPGHTTKTEYDDEMSVLAHAPNLGACTVSTGTPTRLRPNFRLMADRSALALNTPNGGERYLVGAQHEITWEVGCALQGNMRLEYSTNSGNNWTEISTTVPNTGSYMWTVPNATGANTRVRLSGNGQEGLNDISDADFTIALQNSTLNIIEPNLTSEWQIGENKTITWTTGGLDPVDKVDIFYTTDGTDWTTVVSDLTNTGSYVWNVPDIVSVSAKVKVQDAANVSISDMSDAFDIIAIAAPTNLTASVNGQNIGLSWTASTATNISGYVILRGADAASLNPIDVVGNVTSYSDIGPAECTDFTYALKTIVGGRNSDLSNTDNAMITPGGQQVFEITSPNGGEILLKSSQWEITWKVCSASFLNAKLEYSLNNGVNWITIVSSVSNTGSYYWTLPATTTQSGMIRVSDAADPLTNDISDAVFSIVTTEKPAIDAGRWHTAVLKPSTGRLWLWGENPRGGLGDGTTINRSSPQELSGLSNVAQLALGNQHSIALAGGSVYTWGANYDGQLGIGSTADKYTPQHVTSLGNVKAVYTNQQTTSYALKTDGTLWAWGENDYWTCGDGTTIDRHTPVKVSTLTDVVHFAGGNHHSYAVKSDGTVWAWGPNGDNALGTGYNEPDAPTPTMLPNLSNIVQVAAREAGGAALKSDGTVWVWGTGCTGDGTCNTRYTPVQIANFSGVKEIACGEKHTLAVKHDGTLWVWGENDYGQLGKGNYNTSLSPTQIVGFSDVKHVAAGHDYSLIYRTNGLVCLAGRNNKGQLGNGTTTDETSFICLQQSFLREGKEGGEVDPAPVSADSFVRIFPNPGNGFFTVELLQPVQSHVKVSIVDMLGREIWSMQKSGGYTTLSIPVDLRQAPRGAYVVRIVKDYIQRTDLRVSFR